MYGKSSQESSSKIMNMNGNKCIRPVSSEYSEIPKVKQKSLLKIKEEFENMSLKLSQLKSSRLEFPQSFNMIGNLKT